jgi:hypothetical protein
MRRRVHVATRHAEADDSTFFRSRKMRQWTLDQRPAFSEQEKNRSVQGPSMQQAANAHANACYGCTVVLVWPVRTGTVRLCGVASSSYIRTASHVRHTTYEYSCMLLACWPAGHPTVHGSPLQQHGRCRGHTAVIACCCTGGRRPPAGRSPPLCGTSPLQVSKVTAMSTTTTTATTTAAGGATTTVTTTTTAPEDPALFHGGNPELA